MAHKTRVSLIHSPTNPYCYKCSLFIGLNYHFHRVYNSNLQLLQYILGISHYSPFFSGVILSCRPQVLGLRDQPAHQASGFGDGPLDLCRRSPPHRASGFGEGPFGLRHSVSAPGTPRAQTPDAQYCRPPAWVSAPMSGGRTGAPAPSTSAFLWLPAHTRR